MAETETIIISLGGSLIVPNGEIDTDFLKDFVTFVKAQISDTNRRFFIVCGGGGVARHYMKAGKDLITDHTQENIDMIGIYATRLNAEFVRMVFDNKANPKIVDNYGETFEFGGKQIIVGAGWKPGCSTDYDAVLAAEKIDATTIINMSNISHVYDKDPKKHESAQSIDTITWKKYRGLIGDTWTSGMNTPFDPVAARRAEELGLKVIIVQGKPIKHISDYLNGRQFVGTTIS